MTTMTTEPDLDLNHLEAAVDGALAALREQTPPLIARRAKMIEAKDHFDAGGNVLIDERGHRETIEVFPGMVVHNWRTITWKELRRQVTEWKHRYPNQRWYIVPTPSGETAAAPKPNPTTYEPAGSAAEAPQPQPPADKQPVFDIPRREAHPAVMEAITEVVENVLTGNAKGADERRKALIAALGTALADLPVYGIDVEYARVPIGEVLDLGNAVIELDGYGHAARILVDGGTALWDPEA